MLKRGENELCKKRKKFCYSCFLKILHALLSANFYLSRTCMHYATSAPLATSPLRLEGRGKDRGKTTLQHGIMTCKQEFLVLSKMASLFYLAARRSFFSILARARLLYTFRLASYTGSILEQTIFIFTRGVFVERFREFAIRRAIGG